ncbi:hypothetical protein [Nocardia tengchongensis]|uniref:hypothetical protein n=1 Tax=Nocardia tengchongensis TaxID=2055889 RepID=UPI0036C7205A
MSGSQRRRDEELRCVDVVAAIAGGMVESGAARRALFTDAAIAASLPAEQLAIGPYPLSFLAGCVRSLGLDGVLQLPELLVGEEPTLLVRAWMSAARSGRSPDVVGDEVFARWLEMVAVLLDSRRTATSVPVRASASADGPFSSSRTATTGAVGERRDVPDSADQFTGRGE